MSELLAPHDSEAAWTSLGNRMRHSRNRLVWALTILGLYMGAQALGHLCRLDWHVPQVASEDSTSAQVVEGDSAAVTNTVAMDAADASRSAAKPSAPKLPARSNSNHTAHAAKIAENAIANPRSPGDSRGQSKPPRPTPTAAERKSVESLGVLLGYRLARSSAEASDRAMSRVVAAAADYVRGAKRKTRHSTSTAATPAPRATRSAPSAVTLVNSPNNGGAVYFLINGQERSLRPGQSQQLPAGRWRIEFDRGQDFGETSYALRDGRYRFEVTSSGWELRRSRD
jgi:hypothetical protein